MTDDLIRYNQTGYDRGMEPAKDGAWIFYAAAADRIDALEAEMIRWKELRDSIATIANFGDDWPAHGNAPLAIAASYALLKARTEKAEAEVAKLRRTIEARDRRINRLVEALRDAQAKGYVTEAEKGPAVVLSDAALTAPADPQHAPGMTDLMVDPASINAFMDANPLPADPQPSEWNEAIRDVIAERQRQISEEGWTPRNDDAYQTGDLADAAACYAMTNPVMSRDRKAPVDWPWAASWWKPTNRRRDLVKAGALILAEIERLDRAALLRPEGGE